MADIYVTQFSAGDKNKQVRVNIFKHLPEFSHVRYTCSDCGKDNYSCLNEDKDINKAHFGNRNGEPICYMCWKKILQEERERVISMFGKLKVSEFVSIRNGYSRVYFRKAKILIMVSHDQYKWRRYKIKDAVELWRKYEELNQKKSRSENL